MQFAVADIAVELCGAFSVDDLRRKDAYAPFLSDREPDVTIQVQYGDACPDTAPFEPANLVFDSETIWRLYQSNGQRTFVLQSPALGPQPYRIAAFDAAYARGWIWCRTDPAASDRPDPLEFPLCQLIMTALLAQGRGILVHACGVDDHGRGYLFAGSSTAGKTTMARLWEGESRILNDDRVILRRRDGQVWMYGTPWHGDHNRISPDGIPVEKIFFLEHGGDNTARRTRGAAACAMLLARAFPPLWSREGMEFSAGFCADIVTDIPCCQLGFVPNADIMDFVRCIN